MPRAPMGFDGPRGSEPFGKVIERPYFEVRVPRGVRSELIAAGIDSTRPLRSPAWAVSDVGGSSWCRR
jgi:hypothetical protein